MKTKHTQLLEACKYAFLCLSELEINTGDKGDQAYQTLKEAIKINEVRDLTMEEVLYKHLKDVRFLNTIFDLMSKRSKLFAADISKSRAKELASMWSRDTAGYGFLGLESKIVKSKKGKGYDFYLGLLKKDHYELLKQGYRQINGEEALKLLKKGKIKLEDLKTEY